MTTEPYNDPTFSLCEPEAAGDSLLAILAAVLTHMVALSRDESITDQMALFITGEQLQISIADFLDRLRRLFSCTNECFILALIYIHRIIKFCNGFRVCNLNVHRLLVTSVMLATKFCDDTYSSNTVYAQAGYVSTNKLNDLEWNFLVLINYTLYVSPTEYDQYRRSLFAAINMRVRCSLPRAGSLPGGRYLERMEQPHQREIIRKLTADNVTETSTSTEAARRSQEQLEGVHGCCNCLSPGVFKKATESMPMDCKVARQPANTDFRNIHPTPCVPTVAWAHPAPVLATHSQESMDRCCRICRSETNYYCCHTANSGVTNKGGKPIIVRPYGTRMPQPVVMPEDHCMGSAQPEIAPVYTPKNVGECPSSYRVVGHRQPVSSHYQQNRCHNILRTKRIAKEDQRRRYFRYDHKHIHFDRSVAHDNEVYWESPDKNVKGISSNNFIKGRSDVLAQNINISSPQCGALTETAASSPCRISQSNCQLAQQPPTVMTLPRCSDRTEQNERWYITGYRPVPFLTQLGWVSETVNSMAAPPGPFRVAFVAQECCTARLPDQMASGAPTAIDSMWHPTCVRDQPFVNNIARPVDNRAIHAPPLSSWQVPWDPLKITAAMPTAPVQLFLDDATFPCCSEVVPRLSAVHPHKTTTWATVIQPHTPRQPV